MTIRDALDHYHEVECECDRCHNSYYTHKFHMLDNYIDPVGELCDFLRGDGWIVTDDEEFICPDCQEQTEDDDAQTNLDDWEDWEDERMTDVTYRKTNRLTGIGFRIHIKNLENAKPEVQSAIQSLINAVEYPKQTNLDDWEDERMKIQTYNVETGPFDIGNVDGKPRLVRTFTMTLKMDVKTFEEIHEIQKMINECEGKETSISFEKKDG